MAQGKECAARGAQTEDCESLLVALVESLLIIGHDGEHVHAEIAMTFELHERLEAWWADSCTC
ncbi:hypothetical protein CHELA20_52156 [Hyphomicrobiales bacterium]|nr:hypothetical protein CHELA41_22764 [Hyphomicrobiales bacterium]CAH1680930.1 hypothetical protein CHELA20_52156 [Hyphomicrobiales bacterium]